MPAPIGDIMQCRDTSVWLSVCPMSLAQKLCILRLTGNRMLEVEPLEVAEMDRSISFRCRQGNTLLKTELGFVLGFRPWLGKGYGQVRWNRCPRWWEMGRFPGGAGCKMSYLR